MGHRWIVDVLTDLRTYAYMNNLHVLAQELDACARVALDETAISPDMPAAGGVEDGIGTRDVSGTGGSRLWIG